MSPFDSVNIPPNDLCKSANRRPAINWQPIVSLLFIQCMLRHARAPVSERKCLDGWN